MKKNIKKKYRSHFARLKFVILHLLQLQKTEVKKRLSLFDNKVQVIKYYTHNEIDKERWNRCINDSAAATVFVDFDFLCIADPEWGTLVKGDYEAVMPLPHRSKFGISYVFSPPFYFRLGVFSPTPPTPQDVADFVRHIPSHFAQVDLNLNESNSDELLRNKTIFQISHQLRLDEPYEVLLKNFSRSHKHNIKVAAKFEPVLDKEIQVKDVIDLFRNNRGRDRNIRISDADYGCFLKMTDFMHQKGLSENWGVRDEEGHLLAGACFLHDHDHLWFWFSGRDESRSERRAMFYLLDRYIEAHAGSGLAFGMSGSRNKNVADLYRGFGAERYTYPMLNYCNNPWLALPIRLYKLLKNL